MCNLIIVDDNLKFSLNLYNQISQANISDLNIFHIDNSGKKAIQTIINYNPDIILLDLQMSDISGINILDKLIENNINSKVIIMSGYPELIYKCRNYKYYDYIYKLLAKPFSINSLLDTLKILVSELDKSNIKDFVIQQLNSLNFSHKSIGYFYLIDVITLIIEKNYINYNLEKYIYEQIAKKYNKAVKVFQIKWNINKLIGTMYRDTDMNTLHAFFNTLDDSKPTIKLIINSVVEKYNKKLI